METKVAGVNIELGIRKIFIKIFLQSAALYNINGKACKAEIKALNVLSLKKDDENK